MGVSAWLTDCFACVFLCKTRVWASVYEQLFFFACDKLKANAELLPVVLVVCAFSECSPCY